jgi:hypothetical protein
MNLKRIFSGVISSLIAVSLSSNSAGAYFRVEDIKMEHNDVSCFTVSWLGYEHDHHGKDLYFYAAILADYLCTRSEVSTEIEKGKYKARCTEKHCYFHFPVQAAQTVAKRYTPGKAGSATINTQDKDFKLSDDWSAVFNGGIELTPESEKLHAALKKDAPHWNQFLDDSLDCHWSPGF